MDAFSPKIELISTTELRPHPRNARTHSTRQIDQIVESYREFGVINPIVVDAKNTIVAGHARWLAAQRLNIEALPCVRADHLSETQLRAFMLADNKIASNAGWDEVLLTEELKELQLLEPDLDLQLTGFSIAEIDEMFEVDGSKEADDPAADRLPKKVPARVKPGDIWQLGPHRLICGDARDPTTLGALMGDELAQMVLTDPPFNVRIPGHAGGKGSIRHGNFAMASGEMTKDQFAGFLGQCFEILIRFSIDGSIHFICMDWRHMGEMLQAGACYTELKNLIVWVKDNGGMGSFYRSRHELIFAYKNGTARHINNFGLGETGRNRTNVWQYRGMSSRSKTRDEELELHPTVKPVAMIVDALKDASSPNGIVLDVFAGSGSTLIAAHKTGRRARLVEIDPTYCDRIIQRWELYSKDQAVRMDFGSAGGGR
ncbi:MAG: site-specific DNA-methyltransferase [Hyphomicrobiaceae bacterium]